MECTPTGYWEMRSLGQFIRKTRSSAGSYLCTKRPVKLVSSPPLNPRYSMDLKSPHLPRYISSDNGLEQCVAIMRDVAKTHGLGSRSVQEAAHLKDLEQWADELSANLAIAINASPASGDLLNNYKKNMGCMLEPWAEHLKERQWALGVRLTYVDFLLYEALDWHHDFRPDAFLNYPVLIEYLKRFREFPYGRRQGAGQRRRERKIHGSSG